MTDAIPTFSLWRRLCHTRLRDVLRGRLDSSLDWRQLIVRAELPPEVADAILRVVGGTRLWRSEKVDVAAELIAHFQDGLEAGRSLANLLETFGDPQAAARLIRRAKRRGRPVIWHAWRYASIGAVALLLVYVGIGLWMATGRPSVKTDYLAKFNKTALAAPEDERAWPLYRDALLAIGAKNIPQHSLAPLYDGGTVQTDRTEWKDLIKLLTDHADSIAKMREAAKRPILGFVASVSHADFAEKDRLLFGVELTPEQITAARNQTLEDRFLISTLLPHMNFLRSSATLLASDAHRAAAAGDGNTALADVVALFGVSRQCEATPFMICLLVAQSIQQDARAAIREIVGDHPDLWTNDQLRDLAHQMAASRIDWQRGFEGERACFYDSMQRIYTDNGHGDGRLALHVTRDKNLFQLLDDVGGTNEASVFSGAGMATLALPAANMVVASRKEMTDMYDKVTNQALARMATPYWKWANEPSLDDEVASLRSTMLGRFHYLFVLMLTPSHDKFLSRAVVSDGDRDGVFIGLALELYHREHGKWPKSLDELSPRWLPAMPLDPITGKPLHYKVVNDRPVVYSVGVDGDDDGGRVPKNISGESHPEYAAPTKFDRQRESVKESELDGDWVTWPTISAKHDSGAQVSAPSP